MYYENMEMEAARANGAIAWGDSQLMKDLQRITSRERGMDKADKWLASKIRDSAVQAAQRRGIDARY